MIRSMTWFGLGIIVALAGLWPIRLASAQDNWNDGTGNWSVPVNWSAGVPGSGAIVNIDDSDGISRTITYDYTGTAVTLYELTIDLTGGSGSATNTLAIPGNNLTVNDGELVGFYGGGSISQTGGINDTNGLLLGSAVDSTGTYTLHNGSLTVSYEESVGASGTGYFNQNGGTNTVGVFLKVGDQSGSTGTYTLSGTGSLNTNGSSSDEYVGFIGTGHFNQMGGTNTVGGYLSVGDESGSTGTYTLSGGSVSAANIYVGGDPSVVARGQGTLTISETGSLTTPGALVVYNAAGNALNLISGGTINTGSLNLSGNPSLFNWTTGTLNLTNSDLLVGPTGLLGASLNLGAGKALGISGTITNNGTINLTGGTLTTGSFTRSGNLGLFNWTAGTLNVTNGSVEIDNSANANLATSLMFGAGQSLSVSGVETIGGSGTGSLTQSGGSNTINGADALTLGGANGSTGTYTLSGGTLSSFGFEYVGFDGTGNFNHSGGTNEINFGYSLYVGYGADSNGTYTLSGSGSLITTGNEYVGAAGIGNFNQSSGSNSMSEGGILCVGQQAGSSGSYSLSGGTLSAANIYVGGSDAGPGGTGVLTVSGSGYLNSTAATITVYNTAGSGLNVNGGTVNAAALNLIGTYTQTAGSATYGHITGGGQMAVSGGQVILTDDTSGHLASVNVSGTTTLGFDIGYTSSSQIVAGTATFNAAPTIAFTLSGYPEGGTVFTLLSATHLNDNGNLGSLPTQAVVIGRDTLTPSLTGGSGAAGAIIVTITGGPANLIWIGNNNIGPDTGGAWDTQTTRNWKNHSNEALTPDLFYAGDHVTFDDTAANFVVDLNSGDVIANSVIFNNSLHAYTVNGVNGIAGATGVTFAGSNSVTLNTYNSYTGTTTISGGGLVSIAGSIASPTINVTHGTLQLAADYALSGTPVVTLGNGTTTGTLDLGGFMNTVGGLSGGAGNLVTNTSSGSATLNFAGSSSTFGGVIQDGNSGGQVALNITSGSLTLSGTNTYSGGTTVSGGTLAVNGSILGDVMVNGGGTLAGHGTVGGMLSVASGGFLSPGNGPTGTGTITLGALTLYSGSQTNIKLAGTTPGSQYDQVQVTGSASLAGTLAVTLIGGFTPQAGETFDILTGSTPSGNFDTLELPSLTGALTWDTSQLYTSGELSVGETFLLGDFNRDGHVDASDILAMEQALTNLNGYEAAKGLTNAQLLAIGDINNDGVVNTADLQALLDLLNSGGGSSTAVPEPASLVLLAAGSLMLMLLRGRSLFASTAHDRENSHSA